VDELRRSLDEASLERINARLVHERRQAAEERRLRRERQLQEEDKKASSATHDEEGGREGQEETDVNADADDAGGDEGDDDALPEPAELMELSNQQLEDVHAEIDRRKEAVATAAAADDEQPTSAHQSLEGVIGGHDQQGVGQRAAAAERRQKRQAKLRYLDLLADICNLRIQVLAYRYLSHHLPL
jgi:hypothetical protein